MLESGENNLQEGGYQDEENPRTPKLISIRINGIVEKTSVRIFGKN